MDKHQVVIEGELTGKLGMSVDAHLASHVASISDPDRRPPSGGAPSAAAPPAAVTAATNGKPRVSPKK